MQYALWTPTTTIIEQARDALGLRLVSGQSSLELNIKQQLHTKNMLLDETFQERITHNKHLSNK